MAAMGGGLLEFLSDDSDSGGENESGGNAHTGMRGKGGSRSGRVKTPDMAMPNGFGGAHRQKVGEMPSFAEIRQYVSRPSTAASSASAASEAPIKSGNTKSLSMKDYVDMVEGLIDEKNHREAAWRAVEGLKLHPECDELIQLAKEATGRLRRYPRFKESLALVTLTGPDGNVIIGNNIQVAYTYKHMTPKVEYKRFAPLSQTVREKVQKHDAKQLRMGKSGPDNQQVGRAKAVAKEAEEGSGEVEGGVFTTIMAGLPQKRPELGEGWTEQDEAVLKEIFEELEGKGTLKDMVLIAEGRIREQLHGDLESMFRMLRLYESMRNLEAINLCESSQNHNERDRVSLFRVSRSSLDGPASDVADTGVCVCTITVPEADQGTIDFSEASLSQGLHEFRYLIDGSDTPAAISLPFSTVKPLATIGVPSSPVACGDPFRISFQISLTRPHSTQDWIGIYKLTGCGPDGCVLSVPVPEGNQGSIDLPHTPDFPGDYHATYHLGGHSDAKVGTSQPFPVRLRTRQRQIDNREVRLFLCSTVTDMQAERSAVIDTVIPELQRHFEVNFLTISLIPMSWGTRRRDEEPRESVTLSDLKIGLDEVEECRPFFISIMGERRGPPAPPVSDEIVEQYPWLRGQRLDRYTLPGKYSSIMELEILNGFLVQPEAACHSIFFVRDPDFARRAGLERKALAKYLADSELGREAVRVLKEELRSMPCKYVLFEGTERLCETLVDHLKQAISEHHPLNDLSEARKICICTDMLVKDLVSLASERHPSFTNIEAQLDILEEGEPVVIKGPPGSGVSSLMAAIAHAHIQRLMENQKVKWSNGKKSWGEGVTGTSYSLDGETHLFLFQVVGNELSVTTESEIIEQAMRLSDEELSLGLTIPWHPDDVVKLVPKWLDLVCAKAKFTWMIDGLDHMMGENPIEAMYSHENKVKIELDKGTRGPARNAQVTEAKETLTDIEDKEKLRLFISRTQAQMGLRRWLIPLIDSTGNMCASIRFPKLQLVLSVIEADPEEQNLLIRPLDTLFQGIISDMQRPLPKVVEMQSWSAELRKRYVQERVSAFSGKASEESLHVALDYLVQQSRPPAQQAAGSDQAVRDKFGTTHFLAACVDDVLSCCEEGASVDDLTKRFNLLDKCDTVGSLMLRQLKNLRNFPGAETTLKALFLCRMGLREMELMKLLGEKDDVTGEEFKLLMHRLRHVTVRVAGFIQLRASYRRIAWRLFKSVENRLEQTIEICDHFMSETNVIRQVHELPALLLRTSKLDLLLEFLCSQKNMHYVGKGGLFRYFKAVGWASDIMANVLKRNFEAHFCVESQAPGKKYDLQRLLDKVQKEDLANPPEVPPDAGELAQNNKVPSRYSKLPSQRRKWFAHDQQITFCAGALETIDFLLRLDVSALEPCEAILESLVKMLHQADSLAMVAERSTKYPVQSLECIRLWMIVFTHALRALPSFDDQITSPTMRHDQRQKNQARAVQELIFAKVKLLNQTIDRIQDDTASNVSWKALVAGDVLLETLPKGVADKASRTMASVQRLVETLSKEGLDPVPASKLEKSKFLTTPH